MRAWRRARGRGQTLVEFSLVLVLMLVTFFGIIDFSLLFAGRISTTDAVRNSARYAAVNPTGFDKSSNPSVNSIQGRLVITSVPAKIVNDDTHVTISYIVADSTASGITCGTYSQAGTNVGSGNVGGITFASGYSFTNCVIPGDLIVVRASYTYGWVTPFLKSWFPAQTITAQASELEEV